MTKEELKQGIINALSVEATDNPETAEQLKNQMAENLSTLIDSFVQSQLGERLSLIPEAIQCPAPDGIPVQALKYNELIRKQ